MLVTLLLKMATLKKKKLLLLKVILQFRQESKNLLKNVFL